MNEVVKLAAAPLERRAERIRKLMSDMVHNSLSLGAELEQAREHFEKGPKGQRMGWKTWLKDEFNFSFKWATRLISVHRKFSHRVTNSVPIPAVNVLEFMARDVVPEDARTEIIKRTAGGEVIGKAKAKKIVAKHLPSPRKANAIAAETGKPTAASDGYVYLGASAEEAKQSVERRTVVYAVREAIERIATLELSPDQFLEYAADHQLWKAREEYQIETAVEWLKILQKSWPSRREQIRK